MLCRKHQTRFVSASARVDAHLRRHGVMLEVVGRDDLGPTLLEVLIVGGRAVRVAPDPVAF
jgi:hypothetical protein